MIRRLAYWLMLGVSLVLALAALGDVCLLLLRSDHSRVPGLLGLHAFGCLLALAVAGQLTPPLGGARKAADL